MAWNRLLCACGMFVIASIASAAPTQTISLNGDWQYALESEKNQPPKSWGTMTIPNTPPEGAAVAWFQRTFTLPTISADSRVLIHFNMVNQICDVTINGRDAGHNAAPYTPFEFDITSLVHVGENLITIRVQNVQSTMAIGFRVGRGLVAFAGEADQAYTLPVACEGSNARYWGIYDDVSLKIVPSTRIADVFAIPNVRQATVAGDVTLKNASKTPFRGRIEASVVDGQTAVITFPAVDVAIDVDKSQTVSCAPQSADKLEFWWPRNFRPASAGDAKPKLYHLVVRLIDADGTCIDEQRTRFGYRQMWVSGERFVLNNIPLYLLGTGAHWPEGSDVPAEFYNILSHTGARIVRLHATPRPKKWYDLADELGVMIKAESAIFGSHQHFAVDSPKFWQACRSHLDGWMHALRNNPSIVSWSIENEMGLDSIGIVTDPKVAELAKFARTIDPTRTIEAEADGDLGGKLDIINIHCWWDYRKPMWPEDNYWLESTPVRRGYRVFTNQPLRGKPLYIGEFSPDYTDNRDQAAIVVGDRAYSKDFSERYGIYGEITHGRIEGYRWTGVAGIGPWTIFETGAIPSPYSRQHQHAYRPIALILRDVAEHVFGDTDEIRRTMVLNDSADSRTLTLVWKIISDGKTLVDGSQVFGTKPADHTRYDLKLHWPKVDARTAMTLSLELKSGDAVIDSVEKEVWVFPKHASLASSISTPIVVVGSADCSTQAILKLLGVNATPTDLAAVKSLKTPAVCIISQNVISKATAEKLSSLREFVNRGGVVLAMPQRSKLIDDAIPASVGPHASTFVRAASHPLWATPWPISNSDLRWWQGGLSVCSDLLTKPEDGAFTILADGGYGNNQAAMVSIASGRGEWILCQYDVISRFAVEPMAGEILSRLVHYAADRATRNESSMRVAVLAESALANRLVERADNVDPIAAIDAAVLTKYNTLIAQGSVLESMLADASARTAAIDALKQFVSTGGTLYLKSLSMNGELYLQSLIPQLQWAPGGGSQLMLLKADGLTSGLGASDFRWCDDGNDGIILNLQQVGSSGFVAPNATAYTSPALLIETSLGRGRIIIDQIDWDALRTPKANRIASTLMTQIGVGVRAVNDSDLSDAFTIDLSKHVNRTFIDEVGSDEKGGWSDQGANDMRCLAPGRHVLRGAPYDVCAKNGGMAILLASIRSTLPLPDAVTGIAVNRKAAGLMFLHGCGWGESGTLWTYIIHYADGTSVDVPVRGGIEVSDWWQVEAGDLPGAKQAYRGQNPDHGVCLYAMPWKNPHPDVEIKSIDIRSDKRAMPFILAITGRTAWPKEAAAVGVNISKTQAEWPTTAIDPAKPITVGRSQLSMGANGEILNWHIDGKNVIRQLDIAIYNHAWLLPATPKLKIGMMPWPNNSTAIVSEGTIDYLAVRQVIVMRPDGSAAIDFHGTLTRDVSSAELQAFRAYIRWDAETLRDGFINGSSLGGAWRRLIAYGAIASMLPTTVTDHAKTLGVTITTTPQTNFVLYDYRLSDADGPAKQWDMTVDTGVVYKKGETLHLAVVVQLVPQTSSGR